MREIKIFDIRFLDGSLAELLAELNKGGAMVIPSAPVLSMMHKNQSLHEAIKSSHFAIFDSGFLCILLALRFKLIVKKNSGLAFLSYFFSRLNRVPENSIFLVDPTHVDGVANRKLLQSFGYNLMDTYQYIAPMYDIDKIIDPILLLSLKKLRPKYVLLNIGGGVQERLAQYLMNNLDYSPSIICSGAAIAFLTGRQARIPTLVDRFYMGWFVRCLVSPKLYVSRYFMAFRLALFLKRDDVVISNQH
jgi:UDP-N-acetyl-D-mannosaminuronic acid transferase (WecB/TagA/CpsF family)